MRSGFDKVNFTLFSGAKKGKSYGMSHERGCECGGFEKIKMLRVSGTRTLKVDQPKKKKTATDVMDSHANGCRLSPKNLRYLLKK